MQSVKNMVEDTPAESTQILIRVTPNFKEKIQRLVDAGKYTTISDFARNSMVEKMIREEVEANMEINLLEQLDRPEVRKKIKDIWREFLQELR